MGQANALRYVGSCYRSKKNWEKCITCMQEIYDIYSDVNHKSGMGEAIHNTAFCYFFMDKLKEAKEESKNQKEIIKNQENEIIKLNELAEITKEKEEELEKQSQKISKLENLEETNKKQAETIEKQAFEITDLKKELDFMLEIKQKLDEKIKESAQQVFRYSDLEHPAIKEIFRLSVWFRNEYKFFETNSNVRFAEDVPAE